MTFSRRSYLYVKKKYYQQNNVWCTDAGTVEYKLIAYNYVKSVLALLIKKYTTTHSDRKKSLL